jgi:hypothetical protein
VLVRRAVVRLAVDPPGREVDGLLLAAGGLEEGLFAG